MAARNDSLFDDAAEESDDQQQGDDGQNEGGEVEERANSPAGSDVDSSEEEEGGNEYDMTDKFIAPEDEEEAGDESESDEEGGRRKKRKRRRREEEELDEEDFALLEEQGVRVDNIRRKQAAQRKRIRQKKDETTARQSARTAEEQVQHELFGEDADAGLEDEPEDTVPAQQERQMRYDDEGLDSEDDFIDDDIGDGVQGQRPRRARSKIRTDGVHSQAVQEAFDIFGDVGDLLEIYDQRKKEEADGADEEQEPDFSDEEAAETFRVEQEDRRAKRAFEKLAGKIEPGMMAKHFMRPEDNTIRTTDVPEREQLYRGPDPSNMDFQAMTMWVYRKLLALGGNPETRLTEVIETGIREVDGGHWHYRDLQDATRDTDLSLGFRGLTRYRSDQGVQQWADDAQAQAQVRTSIETVLRQIYEEHLEVPVIAMHRKESCGELLAIDEDYDVEEDDGDYRHPRVTPREDDTAEHPAGTMQAHHRCIRQWRLLYAIQAWGDRWRALERRKDRQRQAFDSAVALATDTDFQQSLEEVKEQVDQAESIEEVEDLERQLRLMSDSHSALAAASGMRQLTIADRGRSSNRVSAHSLAKKAGLGPAVAAAFLRPSEFGENLETSTLQNAVNDPQQPPEDLTVQYIAEGFATVERVLDGMHKIAVADVVADASVRKHIRELYLKHAVVSTAPTLSGESVLNPFHPYGTVRHLLNKPVAKFIDSDQYLLIAAAEKEGLLKVTFKVMRSKAEDIRDQMADVLLEQTKELYCSQSVSTTARAWNELREKVLVDVLDSFLKPQFERELRSKLLGDAREHACLKCSRHIWKLAVEGPIALKDRHNLDLDDRKFMVAIWAPGGQGPSTTFVMLDLEGNVVDMLYCGQLSGNIVKLRDYSPREREEQQASRKFDERFLYQRHIEDDPRKGKDLQRLYDFVLEHVPNVMLVATTGQYAEVLFSYVSALKDVVVSKNAQLLTSNSESGRIDIKWADQSVAQVWENSTAAKEELADQPVLVRRAVAIGRTAIYGQLPILCSLAGPTKEILALNMHPMQKAVAKEELFKAAERALVTAVAQIGLNINLVAQTPWMTPQLQFVPGLGPRKALAVLKWVQRQDHLNARRPLYKDVGCPLGKQVFWNAAPALRIKQSALVEEPDPLDDTRIHPQYYTLAVSLCNKALEGSKHTVDDDDDQLIVEQAMRKHPDRILALDLVEMNQRLREQAQQEDREYAGSLTVLIDISFELLAPFKDLRRVNLRDLSITEAFWLLSGETEDTLKPGRRVQATVQGLSAMAAFCTLPDVRDMEAVISSSDISSSGDVRPDSRLRRGDTIPARIKRVIGRRDDRSDRNDEELQAGGTSRIYLVTTSTAMADERTWELEYCTDKWYQVPTEEDRAKLQAERSRSQRKQQFVSRTIFHPSFKNVSMPEAIALLGKEGETSRWLFRPSNKGTHQISITMKLHTGPDGNDLFLHQDIREGRKQAGGVGGHLKLGSPLTIQMPGSEALTFEDLDDVIANFAEPYLENVRALVTHRKFLDGEWDTVQNALSAERARPAYKLSIRYEQPGIFYLAFVLRTTPARENFSVLPSGYYYRKKVFSTLDAAIDKFKRQPINPETQQALPSNHQPAYQYPVTTADAAYSNPSYPAAAAAAQYTGAPYDASAYAGGQYAAYSQQQYQQPYAPTAAATAANVPAASQPGGPSGYDQQTYAYAQQPAAAQAPPSDGSWLAQYQTGTADYSAYAYAQPGQPAAYDAVGTQQYAGGAQPPPPPTEVPPPPPV